MLQVKNGRPLPPAKHPTGSASRLTSAGDEARHIADWPLS